MSITTLGVNLAWRIETSSFQNTQIRTSSSLSLTWEQVQSYLVNLGQSHSCQSSSIIFSILIEKNHLVQSSHPRTGYSQRPCQWKAGVFQIRNAISELWTAADLMNKAQWFTRGFVKRDKCITVLKAPYLVASQKAMFWFTQILVFCFCYQSSDQGNPWEFRMLSTLQPLTKELL